MEKKDGKVKEKKVENEKDKKKKDEATKYIFGQKISKVPGPGE